MTTEASKLPPLIWDLPPPPRQRHLNREVIVAAAVALADEGGPAAVTMSAVAARLGDFTPMALYRHVQNKDGLTDLMLDAATAEIPLPPSPIGPDWLQQLAKVARDTREMTKRHPWYCLLYHTRPPVGPNMMRRLETLLEILTSAGADITAASVYAALLDRHVFGSGLQEAEEARMEQRYGLDDPSHLAGALAHVRDLATGRGYPHLAAWLAAPESPSRDQQFELGLTFLLEGIANELGAGAR